jgi:hypothetical protein
MQPERDEAQRMNQQEYVEQRLDHQIAWYDGKSQSNQRAYKRLRIFEIVAASAIPLLSAGGRLGDHAGMVVGVLGASIAVCSGVSALFKFHELWIEYRTIAETLRHHRFLFLTKSRPYHEPDSFSILVDAVEGVISKENSNWGSFNRPRSEPAPAHDGKSALAAA